MGYFLIFLGGIVAFICTITLVVSAFQRSIGTGFLTLLLPFYIFYFAFAQYESENKKLVIACWLGGTVLYIIGSIIFAKTLGSIVPRGL